NPRISPDGKKIAFTVNTSDNPDIWIWDLVRKNLTRLTFDGKGSSPLWTPDGQRIVFASLNTPVVIDAKAADGTGEVEHLSSLSSRHLFPASWAIDGNTLALVESLLGFPQTDIGMLSMKNGGENKPLLQEKYNETQPQISPNGKWMAYISDESGRHEVYVCPFPDVNKGKWQVSTSGGDSPLWSPDGKELFYRSGDAAMALSVKTEPGFSLVGIPQILFRGMHVSYNFNPIPLELNTWDISSDNKRFLMIKSAPFPDEKSTTETPRVINIVLNWTEELKQRVPVK
ncbi:MAG: prkC 10, partial [Acidobacteria bacterium]|nr:prkC 10 [Acidobacteriota bacterium]